MADHDAVNSMTSDTVTNREPKPSKAYLRFESVVKRSLNMLTMQEATTQVLAVTKPGPSMDLSDMSRVSVVLAVAAMDSYFTDIFVERLVPFIRRRGTTKQLVAFLHEAGLDTECALHLLTMKRPFRRIRRMVEAHLASITTQKTGVIDELFAIYGLKHFCNHVARFSGKGDRLLLSIKKLVLRRHKIVHDGDLNSHGQPLSTNPDEFIRRIRALVLFVSKADELLHKQLHS